MEMKNDLVSRYIYAVTKNLPRKTKKDIEIELETLIDDMLDERCKEIIPTDRDIRVVLAELGTPTELFEKYSPDGNKCLIGPPYFTKYKFVLKLVSIAIVLGVGIAGFIGLCKEAELIWYMGVCAWFGMIMSGLIGGFTIVTGIFAFFQWKGISLEDFDDLNKLPQAPKDSEEIKVWEPIVGIVFSVIFSAIFLFVPQIIGVVFSDGGQIIPVFNIEILHNYWYVIIGLTILGIIGESYKIYEGRYTIRLGIVTGITNLLSLILAFMLLFRTEILNPAMLMQLESVFSGEDAFIGVLLGKINIIMLGVIAFTFILDTIVTGFKAVKYSKE